MTLAPAAPLDPEDLVEDFAILDEWEERYRHVIALGKALAPLADADRIDAHKVAGCASQVWLVADWTETGRLSLRGDSDAMIVKGLLALLVRLFEARTPDEALALDARAILGRLGLQEHLSPQRANGLFAMVERIRKAADAKAQGAP